MGIQFDIPTATMKSVQFNPDVSKKPHLVHCDVPKVTNPKEVLLKVIAAGVCGTDIHIIHGSYPSRKGVILGHELAGVVVDCGSEVTTLKPGDRVVCNPNRGCGCCNLCKVGRYNLCKKESSASTVGIFRDGGFAEYCKVGESDLMKIYDEIPLLFAPLCEPLSCVVNSWHHVEPVAAGARIAILGAGIIGNLYASLFYFRGYRNVVVSEINESRIEICKSMGTGFEILSPATIGGQLEKGSRQPFNLIIDTSGNAKAIEAAFEWLDIGAKFCAFGIPNPAHKIEIRPHILVGKEIQVVGSMAECQTFPEAVDLFQAMYEAGRIVPEKLGVKIFNLEQHEEAFQALASGEISKALFSISDELKN